MEARHHPPLATPLAQALAEADMTNVELAHKLGIGETAVSQYRRGLLPPPKRRKQMAEILGKTEEELGW